MRPIDLARQFDVSTQTIRNLEAAGVLPPATRTPSGYRQYASIHLTAMAAYASLSAAHGAAVAASVLSSVGQGELAQALACIEASNASFYEQRQALEETRSALSVIAGQAREVVKGPRLSLTIGELAHRLGVRPSTLRVWEDAGLLSPDRTGSRRYRVYSAAEVALAQTVRLLRQGGYLFDDIRPVLAALRGVGDPSALRAAVDEREAALNIRSRNAIAGASCLHAYLACL